jgi:hypothetical protein
MTGCSLQNPSLPCPFRKADQLESDHDELHDRLPGHPRIKLSHHESLFQFIQQEIWSTELEMISSKLWWMSKQDSGNISPLHRQMVKGRKIIITEDPRLHLIWIDDRIFLKPLPRYLVCHSFWQNHLSNLSRHGDILNLRKAALGYLRTYLYLIQHESDLRIAQDPALGLVSKEVTWSQFCNFTANLNDITDDEVSGRYRYGEIRLTRLNYYAPILLGRTRYQRVGYQYRAYFARIQGPILCAFAFLSILLNCMQVNLAAAAALDEKYADIAMTEVWYWISIIIGVATCFLLLVLAYLFIFKIIREWRFAVHIHLAGRKEQQKLAFNGLHV